MEQGALGNMLEMQDMEDRNAGDTMGSAQLTRAPTANFTTDAPGNATPAYPFSTDEENDSGQEEEQRREASRSDERSVSLVRGMQRAGHQRQGSNFSNVTKASTKYHFGSR